MSAKLCSPRPLKSSYAKDFDEFFSESEIAIIRQVLDRREQQSADRKVPDCKTNLFFGFFFDGTKNNYVEAEKNKTHSNIARLYDCFPGMSVPGVLPPETEWKYNPKRYTHFFRTYIPGVSTPFKQVNDSGKGMDEQRGAASGYLGEARIIWALLQAINNVHRYFLKVPLLSSEEATVFARSITLNQKCRQKMASYGRNVSTDADDKTRETFKKILDRLHAAVAPHWPDKKTGLPAKIDPGIVQTIHVCIFGFSRGAAQARAFTNWLMSLCTLDAHMCGKENVLTLGGFDVVFDFLGLFDTVASVGAGNTMGNSLLGKLFDGHGGWADAEDSLRIPPNITCLHLVAAHELRRSFPLDSISVEGMTSSNCTEIVFPGVHSDVGCGYAPGEQGRGKHPDGNDMLTRFPLLAMYQAARLAGAPLKLELASTVAQKRFEVTPDAIQAFNAYVAASATKAGTLTDIMREQANYQMQWRLMRRLKDREPLEATASYQRADTFDKNDLHCANIEFEEEIVHFRHWLSEQGRAFKAGIQKPGFDNEHEAEWQEIARWWRTPKQLDPALIHFFDDYVHDSRAWFKLVPGNPDNAAEMIKKLIQWDQTRLQSLKENADRKTWVAHANQDDRNSRRIMPAIPYKPVPDGLTDNERNAAQEYARTQKIPTMLTYGREPFASSRGGYLRYRKIYGGWDSVLISKNDAGVGELRNVT